jgi:pimeloyl-ACP methyl ester carboxylesterase
VKKKVYIFINGIFNWPSRPDEWTDRAVTWTHTKTHHYAEKIEYFTTIINPGKLRSIRAKKISRMIEFYDKENWDLVMVGHSNGCEMILKILEDTGRSAESIHLISAACDEDFGTNGLNQKLMDNRIGKIHLYGSNEDYVLKLASYCNWLANIFALNYGLLGLNGPKNIEDSVKDRVLDHSNNSMGHSGWTREKNVYTTIKNIMVNDDVEIFI